MKSVLSVDPSRVVRAVIERHLERFECVVREVTTADEALAAVHEQVPDLVLIDAAAHTIAAGRNDAVYAAVDVVLLTTEHPASTRHERDANVVATLRKPFEQSAFDRAVRSTLGTPPIAVPHVASPRAARTAHIGGAR